MLTIKDVARIAGVSTATVSRVINNHPNVSDITREKVQQVLDELQYVPNMNVVALTKGRTETLALLVPDITNSFFTSLVRGFEDKASSAGYTVTIGNSDERSAKEAKYIDSMIKRRFDGIALIPVSTELTATYKQIIHHGIPLVLVDRVVPGLEHMDMVRGDSYQGAKDLTTHLISLGHRRIGIITGPKGTSTAQERLQGHVDALIEHGIAVDDEIVVHSEYKRHEGAEAMRTLLNARPRPTAVFAGNNFIALGCIDTLRDADIKVPEHMALVCFDDIEHASAIDPFLTVSAQPSYEMGELAAECLIDQIQRRTDDGESRPLKQWTLPPKLVVRRSCGAQQNN